MVILRVTGAILMNADITGENFANANLMGALF
jgi:uncharacterized protein YjbI with pentapeptide repeats